MSQKYPGGFITKSPVAPTTSAASGIWTLDQQVQAQKAGTWPSPPTFIEDLFSCFLYTGNGTTNTITNGIDLSTKGGLVWMKSRENATFHGLYDTVRGTGTGTSLYSNTTEAQGTNSANQNLTAFNTTGFTLGATSSTNVINGSGGSFVSWTFRKQPKFFDVVTYTGASGNAVQNIAHNLGSVPGCIIIKCYDVAGYNWVVYHRSTGASQYTALNTTAVASATSTFFNNTSPTSTQFTVGTSGSTNGDGQNYVAYLFAHDAGGFPVSGDGSTNGISCGSYVGTGATGNTITLGYEPQWLMVKNITAAANWLMYDNMRGMPASATNTGNTKLLRPNLSDAESGGATIAPTATGFVVNTTFAGANTTSDTYIYIAIRRGPMKAPTTGTSVFTPATYTGTGVAATITSAGFPVDLVIGNSRNAVSYGSTGAFGDRLRGKQNLLYSPSTGAEDTTNVSITGFDVQNGISVGDTTAYSFNFATGSYVNWFFRRAPSFFDEVCYTGTGVARTVTHNLAAVPELMIVKCRGTPTSSGDWDVYTAASGPTKVQFLNTTDDAVTQSTHWNDTAPTSSVFTVGTNGRVNESGLAYVAYLFATCAGVSKVGSYTGTATTKQIDCGFTAGARFVLIKRTDSTGAWYVWDTARGIIAGNDPYLLLNTTAAEVTSTDYIDTYNAGFEISSTAPAAINASGGTFIFLAIA